MYYLQFDRSKSRTKPIPALISSNFLNADRLFISRASLSSPAFFLVHSSHVVPHVVHPAEDARASFPAAVDARVVFGFVAAAIFATREPAGRGLGTPGVSTEEVSAVSFVVLAEVAASVEDCLGAAARVGAAPGSVPRGGAVVGDVVRVWDCRRGRTVAMAGLWRCGRVGVSPPR